MLCGEKLLSLNGSAQSIGSPSRMRGKEGDELGLGQTIRITPAYAGKSKSLPSLHIGSRDHPRVCGEKHCTSTPIALVSGSPPHVRGKGPAGQILVVSVGIIPAYAGKSKEHIKNGLRPPGSPPRMRGKEQDAGCTESAAGITPARAGKSSLRWAAIQTHGDHPRVCGEKSAQM